MFVELTADDEIELLEDTFRVIAHGGNSAVRIAIPKAHKQEQVQSAILPSIHAIGGWFDGAADVGDQMIFVFTLPSTVTSEMQGTLRQLIRDGFPSSVCIS